VVGLGERGGDRYRNYSLGMKQRLGIALALLPDPDLLILDEPTNGWDPQGIVEIRSLLMQLGARGKTVFVSSHLLAEIEAACDSIVMIDHGGVVFSGSLADLLARNSPTIRAATADVSDTARLIELVAAAGYAIRPGSTSPSRSSRQPTGPPTSTVSPGGPASPSQSSRPRPPTWNGPSSP
jgi:ABC-2 type transport system ATP-binding protein